MAPHALDSASGGSVSTSTPYQTFTVQSPNVTYTDEHITSKYTYRTTSIIKGVNDELVAVPQENKYEFRTQRKVGKTGMMLVGWSGNNGSTITAAIIANRKKLRWDTREGSQAANYYGSMVMSSTTKLGTDAKTGAEINIPIHSMLPMVNPDDLVIGGWDISGMSMADAMDRAKVLEPTLKSMVKKDMAGMVPLPSIYYPDFIAANQGERADNVIPGDRACSAHLEHIRDDIRYVQPACNER